MTPTPLAPAASRRDPLTPIEPEAEPAAIASRLDHWDQYYRPADDYTRWVMTRVVVATMRLDRDLAQESALRVYEARRARLSWDADRRLAAEDLGARLPRDPARIRRRLEETLQGADWLIERWETLGRIAGSGQVWTDPQRSLAMDLLGIPVALREGLDSFDPGPGQSPASAQREVAESERARLVRLCERALVARDESESSLACSGVSLSFTPAMTRLHRHEALWSREFHRAFAEFRRATRPPADAEPRAPRPLTAPSAPVEPTPPPSDLPEIDLATLDRVLMARLIQARASEFESEADAATETPLPAPAPSSPPAGGNRRARRARTARLRSAG